MEFLSITIKNLKKKIKSPWYLSLQISQRTQKTFFKECMRGWEQIYRLFVYVLSERKDIVKENSKTGQIPGRKKVYKVYQDQSHDDQ